MRRARNPTSIHTPPAAYAHQIELSSDERLSVLSGQGRYGTAWACTGGPPFQLDLAPRERPTQPRGSGFGGWRIA
jgi:hypothetical protein